MGFLDNLESNLKSLEGREERQSQQDNKRREADRAYARAAGEYAEQLKKGSFANEFLAHAVRIGHASRTKVNMVWIGGVLRVEARDRRLEFRPTPEGVRAVFFRDGEEMGSELTDLNGNPEAFARRWLED
jgi:hypothetical protein